MKEKKLLYLTIQQFVFLIYLLITISIFYISYETNHGVTIRMFGSGDDGLFYWEQAQKIANGEEAVLTSIYPLIIGYILKITGSESPFIIRLFNYIGFLLLVITSIELVKLLFKSEKTTRPNSIINAKILLLLAFLFYASLQLNINLSIYRDVWIYTFYIMSVYFSIKVLFYKRNRLINLIFLIPSLWILGEFRNYALMSFILGVIAFNFIKRLKNVKSIITFVVIMVVLLGFYYKLFYDYNLPIVNLSLQQVLNYRLSFIKEYAGGSQMGINLDQSSFTFFLLYYLYSYIGNFIGPLPWQINSVATLVVFFIETIPMTLIIYFLWKNRTYITNVKGYVLLHALIWIALIAVSNDNIGTATRLRPVGWILILIVFVVMYIKKKEDKVNLKKN